jgi:hypothetical protein
MSCQFRANELLDEHIVVVGQERASHRPSPEELGLRQAWSSKAHATLSD